MIQPHHQVSALPVSYDAFIRHGWHLVPINPGSKGPKSSNWNRKENCLTNSTQLPQGFGVGLAHAYSGTCAIDIDEWDTAKQYLSNVGIDLQSLFDAPDAVTIESGNKGHGKLLYATPFGMVLNSKKLIATKEGSKYNFLDFRCATSNNLTVQDCLPPTIHPVTLQPYQFGGRGHWSRLPTLPIELLSLWQALLESDTTRSLKTDSTHNASWDDVKSALGSINPDCDRDQWVSVAMALHHADPISGYSVFDEWSAQGHKYKGPQDINHVWRSLKQDGKTTLGTLFHLAQEAGWSRPMPDVTHLFKRDPLAPNTLIDLISLRIQPPEVPLDLFPPVLRRRAEEVAVSVGCDPVIPLMSGLATACGAADKRIRLRLMPGYEVPPVLWLMTIGDPSDRKTPGAKPMYKILTEIERNDSDRYKVEHLIWRGKEAAHAASMKSYLQANEQATALMNDVAPSVTSLPPEPKTLRLIINDATSQKVVHLSQGRPRGFLMELDEMTNWINKANDPKSGDDRGCWIAAYESRPYRMDRVVAGEITTDNLSIAIYGNLQPQVFSNALAKMATDGLLQRFIPVRVRGDKTVLNDPIPDYMTNIVEYEETIKRIFTLPDRIYNLSPGAYEQFRAFQQWYLSLRLDERTVGSNTTYMTALGKIEGTTGRLALMFHLLESPNEQELSADTMRRAIAVSKSFIVPCLRHAFANEDSHLAEWIQDYLIQQSGEIPSITFSQLIRSARRQIPESWPRHITEMVIRTTLDQLTDAGWLALLEDTRSSASWAINPDIAKSYPEQRKRVIKAKQAIRQSIRDHIEERWKEPSKRPEHVRGYRPEWEDDQD